ncbi:MAG: hypothetical protein GX216_03650, partial [Methanomicrobiales archaeon]|nr:hypothetical protein [Methanomicrobiales archaeon]
MKRSVLTHTMVLLCIVTIALLALPVTAGAAPPDEVVGDEKPVIAKMPVVSLTPDETDEPEETPAPAAPKEKNVTESEPDLVTWGLAPGENTTAGTPTLETLAPSGDAGISGAPATNATDEELAAEEVMPPDDGGTEEVPVTNATTTPEPTADENSSRDTGDASDTG